MDQCGNNSAESARRCRDKATAPVQSRVPFAGIASTISHRTHPNGFCKSFPVWGRCRAERHFFTSAGWMGPGLCTHLPHESHGSGGQGWQGPLESPRLSPGLDPTTLFPAQPGLPRRTQTSSSLTSSTGSRAPHTLGASACAGHARHAPHAPHCWIGT